MRIASHIGLGSLGVEVVLAVVLTGCAAGTVQEGPGGGTTGTSSSAATTTSTGTGSGGAPGCADTQCDPHASCAVLAGEPTCACNAGYQGDGTTCTDIDECQTGVAMCDTNATCANTDGSFTCTCKPGYQGDGTTCADIDECADGTAMCDATMACKNIPGGYSCACAAGYISNGTTCVDINECQTGAAMCDPYAVCVNTPGSFTCTCPPGYEGDGTTCTDIDECQTGAAMCDANATCTNSPGSFACGCNSGYAGNGTTCTPVGLGSPGNVLINAGDGSTSSTSVTLYLQEPGNLISDPSAETAETGTLTGWQIGETGGSGWAAGPGDPAVKLFGPMVYITSYSLDSRSQLLDLTTLGFTQAQLDAAPSITVREWYHGMGYNSSVADSYYLKVELRDKDSNVLASLDPNATTTTTNNTWQNSTQTFTGYGMGLRYVYFEDGGHDVESWSGNYGAAMDAASVVVGDVQVRVSNDNATWSDWQPFAPTMPWTLDAASGNKTVYVQYQDGNGMMWPSVSNAIMLQ